MRGGGQLSDGAQVILPAVFDRLRDAIVIADAAGTIRMANPAAGRLFGADPAALVGSPVTDLMPERFRAMETDAFQRYVLAGEGLTVDGRPLTVPALRADGTEIDVEVMLTSVGSAETGDLMVVATLRDISDQRAELMRRLAALQRSQAFLLRASEVLAGASGYAETIQKLAAVAVPTLGDLCLIDVVNEDGRLVRMAARHAEWDKQPLADELRERYVPDQAGQHPSAEALATGVTRWSPEMSEDFLRATTQDERHFELVQRLGFTSYMSVPLRTQDRVVGVVTLISAGSGRRFGPDDVALAEELADRVAQVVDKAHRYDVEHTLAATLQASLLPAEVPVVPGLSVAVRYLPGTRHLEVGGDFFDVLAVGPTATLIVGDVAGHDMVAAASMGRLRSAARAFATQASGPAELLTLLYQNWDQLDLDRMATAVVVRLDGQTGELRVACAGHPPPVLVGADGVAALLPVDPGPPLGAPDGAVREWHTRMDNDAVLLCYTDGLVEDRRQDIEVGTAALVRVCAELAGRSAEEVCAGVLASMAGDERHDDVAVLAVRRA